MHSCCVAEVGVKVFYCRVKSNMVDTVVLPMSEVWDSGIVTGYFAFRACAGAATVPGVCPLGPVTRPL